MKTMQTEISERIGRYGVVPVAVLDRAEDALPLARALCAGGLPCAEVTFRTAAAAEAIRIMRQAVPDMLVGAGTVLTVQQAQQALDAGAAFLVSPGFDPELVDWCLEREVPVFPGIVTPSGAMQAVRRGLDVVKFFPAAQYGGIGTIEALGAVFRDLRFLPTGGIHAGNLQEYLKSPKVLACGGSWMVKADLIRAGRFDQIRALTAEAVGLAEKIRQA